MNESPAEPRYIVGIDLGTTNCAVSFIDTRAGRTIADLPIRQFTAAGVLEQRDTLPSFLYALPEGEVEDGDRSVDARYRVGVHARDHGALTPGRLVASAKSWLCHGGVDREAPILPWHAAPDVDAISPVEAQAIILKHLRRAWETAHPGFPLPGQEVYITVPASFDEVARTLTVEAARRAGLESVVLLEEPQAAFYAWLSRHESDWQQHLAADDHILICDVGGGTTDFTLIHARPGDKEPVVFHRTAVGDHLILGGDNLDLALAHELEEDLAGGGKLDARSWSTLVRRCRHYKETLLADGAPESIEVVLPGSGSGILRGQRTASLSRDRAEALLLDGFLPAAAFNDRPLRRSSGFQEFGLPYAADAAITRYLAEFLSVNLPRRDDGSCVAPAAVLLNGGLFESPVMRRRLREVLGAWFPGAEDSLRHLEHQRLDLAVARGAAYFGLARRGLGVKVESRLARTYYLGVGSTDDTAAMRLLCLAPAGMDSGHAIRIDQHPLKAQVKAPVEFPLFVSSRRTTDAAGDLLHVDDETFTPMPPLRTILTAGKNASRSWVDVCLNVAINELGALDLSLAEVTGMRSWKLAFDLRAATRTDLAFHDGAGEQTGIIEASAVEEASHQLRDYLDLPHTAIAGASPIKPLEKTLGLPRGEWPVSALRSFWAVVREAADHRLVSAQHEQRWLNLAGYFLRPGFGLALDDWRVSEMWKLFHAGLRHPANEAVRAEWWILWRRLAGGMSAGQQKALSLPVLSVLKQLAGGRSKAVLSSGWDVRAGTHECVELLRMVSSLEHLETTRKEWLGNWLIDRMKEKGADADRGACLWSIGRLGARVPLYGSLHAVVPAETAAGWLRSVCGMDALPAEAGFAMMNLARMTGDRFRDIDDETRALVRDVMKACGAAGHLVTLVTEGGRLDSEEQARAFGETLPRGLVLAG